VKTHTIVVSEWMDITGLQVIREHHRLHYDPTLFEDRQALLAAVRGASALIVRNRTQVDEDLVTAGQRLQVVGRLGAGLDNIDRGAAEERGIAMVYAPGLNAPAVAEWTFGAILYLVRRLGSAHRHVVHEGWERALFAGTELSEHTLGILGFGRIARVLARYLRPTGIRLATYHPRLKPDNGDLISLGVRLVSLDELLKCSTILVVLLPLNAETRGLLSESLLRTLPEGAILVVAGRGGVVDEMAAVKLLQEGALSGLALDVFGQEPPPPSWLAMLDSSANLLLSPHAAGWTETCQQATALSVARDVLNVMAGRAPRFPVPPLGTAQVPASVD